MSRPEIQFNERQTFRQEPYCYDGETCDRHRPRWMTSYPKQGDEEDGEVLKLEIDARTVPPGTRVIIQIPVCPACGFPADMVEGSVDGKPYTEWPPCDCGFSWKQWVDDNFS